MVFLFILPALLLFRRKRRDKRAALQDLSDEKLKKEGIVIDALPDTKFKVRLEDGREVLAYLSGKMRLHYIKVMMGDKVTLELSPDGNKGRIIYRR